jgi:hypothetical protein
LSTEPSKPERDKLVMGSTTSWLRLDQAEPLAGRKGLPQKLCALDPRQRPDVLATELQQIKRNKMKLAGRHGVGLERRSAYRAEVLDGSAVARAQRNQLPVDDTPPECLSQRRQQRTQVTAQASPSTRPGADTSLLVDRDKEPEAVHLGSIAQPSCAGHVAAEVVSIGSGIGTART